MILNNIKVKHITLLAQILVGIFLILILIWIFKHSPNEAFQPKSLDSDINLLLNSKRDELNQVFKEFARIKIPIIINNDDKLCRPWSKQSNPKLANLPQECVIVNPNDTSSKCVGELDELVNCDNYDNNTINNYRITNLTALINKEINDNRNSITILLSDVSNKRKKINDLLSEIELRQNLTNQQDYFVKNYRDNLEISKARLNTLQDENTRKLNNADKNEELFAIEQKNLYEHQRSLTRYWWTVIGLSVLLFMAILATILFSKAY